jgi:NADPH-dependent glutamate synthase beta subunit-like oxidoreductase
VHYSFTNLLACKRILFPKGVKRVDFLLQCIAMPNITDMTKPVDLLQHAVGTGHRRVQRPVYTNFMPPCNSACPAGENIQSWLDHAQAGRYQEAFYKIMDDNPFPALMGRICVKPCETGCNRNHVDTAVNIHAVERFIGDLALEKGWPAPAPAPATGKRVMVVGAGPAGLSAAYHLAKAGHQVEIFEADSQPGGLVYLGVPEYRLPQQVYQAEIKRILQMGVVLQVNYKVQDVLQEKESRQFDAVFLATGAHLGREVAFAGKPAIPYMHAIEFLRYYKLNTLPRLGSRVIVYGGGKLAMYISRIIKRMGLLPVVLYPGDRKLMPAYDFEADDAISEGVDIDFLRRIKSIEGRQVLVEVMQVQKNQPIPTGEEIIMEADTLILAMGQDVDSSLYKNIPGITCKPDGGIVIHSQTRMTGAEGIFAGGDMLPGEQRSSTIAIGHGKKAARNIDAWLRAEVYQKPPKPPTAGYKRLHIWYKTEAPQAMQPRLQPEVAVKSFEEVFKGYSAEEARYEAMRCFSCGNCFECDGCFGACPEDAIIKLGKGNGYKFNYNACTGCAICFEQCPCHAIEMIAEPQKVQS